MCISVFVWSWWECIQGQSLGLCSFKKVYIYIYINKTKPFSLCNFLVSGLLHFLVAAHFLVTAFCDFFLRVVAFSGFWIAAFLTAAHVLVAAHFLVATCYDFFLRVSAFSGCYILWFLPAFSSCILWFAMERTWVSNTWVPNLT